MSVTEPSNAVNAGMVKETEERRLALLPSLRSQFFSWLWWSQLFFLHTLPMKMEQTLFRKSAF